MSCFSDFNMFKRFLPKRSQAITALTFVESNKQDNEDTKMNIIMNDLLESKFNQKMIIYNMRMSFMNYSCYRVCAEFFFGKYHYICENIDVTNTWNNTGFNKKIVH